MVPGQTEMEPDQHLAGDARVFAGDSELARMCRAHDWAATSLGPVERWPAALRVIVRTCLESPFPINLWCGPDLVLIYNDSYRQVLGDKHPSALGRRGREVWAEIWPEIHQMFEGIRAGGPTTFAVDQQFMMVRSGAPAEAWFTYSVSPVRTDAGEIVAFLNIASETTPRVLTERALQLARAEAERAQARLAQAFEQAPVGVCVLRGAGHTFEVVNPRYQRFFPGRALLGRPIRDALPELDGQGVYELLDHVRESGEPYIGREYRVQVDRTGAGELEEGVFNFVYQPVRDADGAIDAIVVVATDVTELVEARRAAEAARQAAEDANAAKAQFLAMMSHELRTPLNAIGGYAQLLELGVHGPVTPAQRDALGRLQASQQHLLGLINAVLNFARLEAGHVAYAREQVRIAEVVAEAEALIAMQAKAMRHTVEARAASPNADVVAVADHEKVRQILVNLLSNAVKFTEPGGHIVVKYGWLHGEARIEVTDTGRGIPADQLPRVFEPFVQIGRSYSTQLEGTGLGLPISRDLARGMGGDLIASSEPGMGSTFTLILPLAGQD